MRQSFRVFPAAIAGSLLVLLPLTRAVADDNDDQTQPKTEQSQAKESGSPAKAGDSQAKKEQDIPEYDLLDAVRQGLVGVEAEGRGDGRMTMSVTNKTKRQLSVVLPPGIVA